jgi:hypothetical protein
MQKMAKPKKHRPIDPDMLLQWIDAQRHNAEANHSITTSPTYRSRLLGELGVLRRLKDQIVGGRF